MPPAPWSVVADDFAYQVRVQDANGRTVCIVPMSVRIEDTAAPQGRRRVVEREAALEIARQIVAGSVPCRCQCSRLGP